MQQYNITDATVPAVTSSCEVHKESLFARKTVCISVWAAFTVFHPEAKWL